MPKAPNTDMSVESAFRNLIRAEIEQQLRPLQDAVNRLDVFATNLAPLTSFLAPFAPAQAAPVRRGRKPNAVVAASNGVKNGTALATGKGRRGRPPKNVVAADGAGCGITGCARPPRSKGYCAAHYQKLRTLSLRNERPSAWVDFPAPGSVADIILPRGRAAAKAKAAR